MTEVMNACDSAVGGASGDDVQRRPKLSGPLPSIVVEPTDGGQVESGELRWPPDDVSSDVTEGHAHVTGGSVEGAGPEEAGPEEREQGGV